jgi:glycosyltransferase involved in cell wall biosynthesis
LHKTWGVPFIQTFHSLGAVKRKVLGDQDSSPINRIDIERKIVQAADRIIATAPQEMEDLRNIYAADPTRITVIPCGVNLDIFRPESQIEARIYAGVPYDEFLITFVGRLEKRKGVDTMLEAMGILITEQPHLPLSAIIVGGQPRSKGRQTKISQQEAREHRRYKEILDLYQISDRVTFTGGLPQDLLYHYYSAGDVTIIPSYYEPFGMTALEALACGSSVIVSRVGGLKSTVVEGEVGLHFEPRNPHDLAKQIKYLIDHPEINARFRKNARPYVEIHYSWESIAERMSSLYREEISKNLASMP